MISGCSTLPASRDLRVEPVKIADHCPPPQAFAKWADFTTDTPVVKGESAFKTVQRLKLAEARRNMAGQRLWAGLKQCRAKKADPTP